MKFTVAERKQAAQPKDKVWYFLNDQGLDPKIKRIRELDKILIENEHPTTTLYNNFINHSSSTLNLNRLGGVVSSVEYDTLLIELVGLVKELDVSGQTWDLNSNFISDTYSNGSVNCYISMKDSFKPQIVNTGDLIHSVIRDNLVSEGKRVFEEPLRFCCNWLATHLHRMKKNKSRGLRYHRANRTFIKASNENKEHGCSDLRVPTNKTLIKCIDILVSEGYALTLKGFKNSSFDKTMMSLLLPTSKLIDLIDFEDIVLQDNIERLLVKMVDIRDKDKRSILTEFYKQEWIVDIERSKRILKKHNQLILDTEITVGSSELEGLQVMRIHNDGSPYYGGRLYDEGTWTTMRKNRRKMVLIGGEPVVTLDLSHLHPSLLYAREGIDIKGFDPYSGVDLYLDEEVVEKYKSFYGISNYNPIRNACKLGLLIMVNSKSEQEAVYAIEKKMGIDFTKGGTIYEDEMQFVGLPRKCGWDIVNQLKTHNEKISKHFCSGISKELMRLDSDIILETLDVLVDNGICSLPLHDSITVAKSNVEFAEMSLRNAYIKVVGSDLNYAVKFE